MLRIRIPETEAWNEAESVFITVKGCTLVLEHSLVSLSKWEAIWGKPFISLKDKTNKETISYIKCMTINHNSIDPRVYNVIDGKIIKKVDDYINHPMTATTINKRQNKFNRDVITNEIIYYWMVVLGIPFDPCQKWHLNRLLTFINVCSIKQQPKKKMSTQRQLADQYDLNKKRKKALGIPG